MGCGEGCLKPLQNPYLWHSSLRTPLRTIFRPNLRLGKNLSAMPLLRTALKSKGFAKVSACRLIAAAGEKLFAREQENKAVAAAGGEPCEGQRRELAFEFFAIVSDFNQ